MRYRVKDYRVEVSENIVWLYFQAPDEVMLTSKSDNEIEDYILQAIRLIVDESVGIVFCSSMQKYKYIQHAKANVNTREVQLAFDIPSGKTIGNDLFTIEMDWGDTINDNIPTDYAKETSISYNTQKVSDIQNYLQSTIAKETTSQQIVSDVAAAKVASQALFPIAQAAEAYNIGKIQLAKNITAKGVEASASETLPELAEKVMDISQQSIILSPSEVGDMYAVQHFGSLTTPNYWNLYEVLNTLLNDGRLSKYGGILLAEYYRDYDSINLSGAGAGGAYVVSDIENKQFKMYTEDITHTWAKEFDGKGNRWVAYCFLNKYHDFEITDTNTSPRSIFIGRNVGNIVFLVDTRTSDIVVPDGNELNGIVSNGHSMMMSRDFCIRNVKDISSFLYKGYIDRTERVYIQAKTLSNANYIFSTANSLNYIIDIENIENSRILLGSNPAYTKSVIIKSKRIITPPRNYGLFQQGGDGGNVKSMYILGIEEGRFSPVSHDTLNLEYMYISHSADNVKTKSVTLCESLGGLGKVSDVELMNAWNKPLDISECRSLTEANMCAHILQRLKQDEPDCGDGVTITLGSRNLEKLTSAESVQLLDDLTNIYGYTFA